MKDKTTVLKKVRLFFYVFFPTHEFGFQNRGLPSVHPSDKNYYYHAGYPEEGRVYFSNLKYSF
nr:hypothetical protein [Aggregatibacter sp. oral taxon 513]